MTKRATLETMQPTLTRYPFSNPDWIFEPKWDGFRSVCFVEPGRVRFISRNQKSLTEKFPTLQAVAQSIKATVAVLDGEIVALDKDGIPCFEGLRRPADYQIAYFAFDLLTLDGRDLTKLPLIERKAALKRILPRRKTGDVRYTDHVLQDGVRLFEELQKMKLEGMVAKRADSPYVGGRTKAWLKIKTRAGQEEMRQRSENWNA